MGLRICKKCERRICGKNKSGYCTHCVPRSYGGSTKYDKDTISGILKSQKWVLRGIKNE